MTARYLSAMSAQIAQADSLFLEGHGLYTAQQWEGAEEKFRAAIRKNPDHPRAILFLGLILQNQRKDYAATLEL